MNSEISPLIKAVIFDIGGVVLRSPFLAIAEYERENGIPTNYLNCSIAARGSNGAWQRFERGELPLLEFYKLFGEDLSDTKNGNVWYSEYCVRRGIEPPQLPERLAVDGRDLFGRMMRDGFVFDEHILNAIRRIRAAGKHRIIALTNNFNKVENVPPAELEYLGWDKGGATPPELTDLFDDFCDSSKIGMRKPEPEFYLLACKRNGILPHEAVFLDDIKMNLKAAKELGMRTIHVPIGGTAAAVKELEHILGIPLTINDTPKGVLNKL